MKVYGQWYGGSSYVWGDADNLEVFSSIKEARNALANRRDLGYSFRQTFRYVDGRVEHDFTPVVGNDSELWLYFDSRVGGDMYPDRIIKFGPRGGVVVERT